MKTRVRRRLFPLLHTVLIWMIILLVATVFVMNASAGEYWEGKFVIPDTSADDPNPENRMAHNVYSNPDLSNTSGWFKAFSIDFRSDYDPVATYWALCNWEMDVSSLREQYSVTDTGGAYAGLQNTLDGKLAIMSFWEIHYQNQEGKDTILNAHRIFPDDNEHYFGGEGEGTNCLVPYEWNANRWYRMLIHCYDHKDSGNTIVEQWLCDLSDMTWTKVSAFDTGLQHSCFIGDMSQFMENYDSVYCNEVRTCQYKNIAVMEYDQSNWTPIKASSLSIDTWWNNKKGTYALGSTQDFIWGITCGYGPDTAPLNAQITSCYEVPFEAPEIPDHILKCK